jgi:hypothetical protein
MHYLCFCCGLLYFKQWYIENWPKVSLGRLREYTGDFMTTGPLYMVCFGLDSAAQYDCPSHW